jgi:hypothetical protein
MLRPRFSLRTLLLAIVLLGCFFGATAFWYQSQKADWQRQIELGNKLQQFEGATLGWKRTVPAWLNWLGKSKDFERISSVHSWQPESISEFAAPSVRWLVCFAFHVSILVHF